LPIYNGVYTKLVSATATLYTVEVSSDYGTVELVAVTGSATRASGPLPGVPSASPTTWTFNRGAALGGSGQAQFRAVLAGTVNDDDFIEIAEQGRDTIGLAIRTRTIASDNLTRTVRVAVVDPIPQGAGSVTITHVAIGCTVDLTSPQTVTPEATFSEAAGTYKDYVITRPGQGAGSGAVVFTATAANRVPDADPVTVPEVPKGTLASQALLQSTSATQVVVRVFAANGIGGAVVTSTYSATGLTVTPASGGTFNSIADVTATPGVGEYIDYTITRPASGGTRRVQFRATATNRGPGTVSVDVPDQTMKVTATKADIVSTSATQVVVRVSAACQPSSATSVYPVYASNGLTITPASGITSMTMMTDISATPVGGQYVDFTITRAAAGVGTGRATFMIPAAADFTSSQASVEVPDQGHGVEDVFDQRLHSLRSLRRSFSNPSTSIFPFRRPRRLARPCLMRIPSPASRTTAFVPSRR